MAKEGYEAGISIPIRVLIDDWEGHLVNERPDTGRGRGKINHYWLIKNMMGVLMEDMLRRWSSTRNIFLPVKANMTYMDNHLSILDATFAWKCLYNG